MPRVPALLAVLLAALPAAAQAPLRLATWNVEWLTERESPAGAPRTDADYAALARYADRLDADVVALQEVDGPAAAARVFDPARYAFYFEPGDNLQRAGFAVRRGLTVVDDPDYVALRDGNDRLRAGAVITVEVAGRPLRLMSVHLKSGCFDRPLDFDSDACRGLRPQVPLLEAWIDAAAASDTAFVVLGDFNRRLGTPGDAVWAELDDAAPAGADLTAVTAGRRSACDNGRYPDYIDHVVLGREAAAWLVPDSFRQLVFDDGDAARLSDHCPISVRLQPGAALPRDVRWVRAAPEHDAVFLQTYRAAGARLRALAAGRTPGTWAVVLDGDETILDNSVYQRRRARVDSSYTPASWAAWVEERAAPALPGAVAFTQLVEQLGGRVVIVTNRSEAGCPATRANLAALGVPAAAVLCQTGPSDKTPRFAAVEGGTVPGLPPLAIAMWVGDNLNDFPAGRAEDGADARFGDTFWMLPNPMYGSWETRPDPAE